MHLNNNLLSDIRKCELKLHCLKVKIWQDIDNGLRMSGHGVIKQNKYGSLYLEFIRTELLYQISKGRHASFVKRFPDDPLDESQILNAEFTLLDGSIFLARGFSLELNLFSRDTNTVMFIGLPSIENIESRDTSTAKANNLYYEIAEKTDLPANKINTVTSTKGLESSSWNETEILSELEDFQANIVKESDRTEITVKGEFDAKDIKKSINFYIGLSNGKMPQPYLELVNIDNESRTIIRSINNQKSHRTSLNLIPSNIAVNNKVTGEHSFTLFRQLHELCVSHPNRFMSLYSQWERVWHSFNSVNEITELVLSVAIEGILNDIYIPDFKIHRVDNELKKEIEKIRNVLDDTSIAKVHLDRLKSSVSYWTDLTAKKALDILEKESVITKQDKRNWSKLRNRSAHPKVKEINSAEEQKRRDEVLSCLDLFNKLMLNVVGYSGHANFINQSEESPEVASLVTFKSVLQSS